MALDRRTTLLGMIAAVAAARADCSEASDRARGSLVVFAAASLKPALDPVLAAWRSSSGQEVVVSYAGSGQLARQIEQGAPADLFVSADTTWMDHVASKKLIDIPTRVDLLGNLLVLVAPANAAPAIELTPGLDLAAHLRGGRLAIGNAQFVPAGVYGKAALQHLGAWSGVADKLAETENVRAALMLVTRGEASLGIVYRTDAISEPAARIIATFPEDSHPRIVYPAALTAGARADARELLAFLTSSTAKSIYEAHGFLVPGISG